MSPFINTPIKKIKRNPGDVSVKMNRIRCMKYMKTCSVPNTHVTVVTVVEKKKALCRAVGWYSHPAYRGLLERCLQGYYSKSVWFF